MDVPYEELQANIRSVRLALSGRVQAPWDDAAIVGLAEQMYQDGSMVSQEIILAYRQRAVRPDEDLYRRGDRVALVRTGDPYTRLRPGDRGTVLRWNPARSELGVEWDSGSTLSVLLAEGDEVLAITRAAGVSNAR